MLTMFGISTTSTVVLMEERSCEDARPLNASPRFAFVPYLGKVQCLCRPEIKCFYTDLPSARSRFSSRHQPNIFCEEQRIPSLLTRIDTEFPFLRHRATNINSPTPQPFRFTANMFAFTSTPSMFYLPILLLFLLFSQQTAAHMVMSEPPPINYKSNPYYNPAKGDGDYTSPLSPSGSNFPCRGHLKDLNSPEGKPVRNYKPGGSYDLK